VNRFGPVPPWPVRAASRRAGRPRRPRFTLVLLLLLSLTLLSLDVRGFAPLDGARSLALAVFAPVGSVTSGVFRPVGDAWSGAFAGADAKRENDELRRQVEDLQGQIAQGRAARTELDRLKDALHLPYAGNIERVTAQVTSGAVSDFDDTVEINQGGDAGIVKGMPVVVDAGLVGTVVTVSGGRAVVRLLSARSMKVGVVVAGGAAHGLVEGQGSHELVRGSQFDMADQVPDGALLVTAGTPGSLFPPGVPVGTVTRVAVDDTTQQKLADVHPVTPLDGLSFVTVLLHRPPP
jgi:rod shape-determining protein MreC